MKYRVRFLPKAQKEFNAAAAWYERQRKGLGAQFIARVKEALQPISSNPGIHAKVHKDVRKAVVRQFPYIVLYREDNGGVIVISVFHTSRNPSEWKSRT